MYDFKQTEEKVLKFWADHKIFEKSLEQRKGKKRFVFFEGPPTANGLPHIGHFLTRIYKDLYGRYKTMRGFYVLRKGGWDTHGLPVELEVEKELGLKSKKEIEEYGVDKFNKKAKANVWRYQKEFEDMTKRMGFWIDLNNPYITYENYYIESVWAVLKKIWDRKLLYQAHKVVPFCTRCGTPLSSHELALGYQTVKDHSVYLKFRLLDPKFKNTYILAWTTTPWTLPGNVALAVGKDIDYAVVKVGEDSLILAKDLKEKVLGTEHKIESEIKGQNLVDIFYEPLFDVPSLRSERSYKIYAADFVSTTDGTGVVHTAVMYGEDDYELGTKLDLPKIHTVDESGKFVGVSPELDKLYVKDKATEEKIISYLQEKNYLLKSEEYEHEYPFCWRCKTPLLYYAKNTWFIRMSSLKNQLIENNSKINWIPEHMQEGRFGQWLKDIKDWALSRDRYWGTPLPIWKCVKCDNLKVVDSVDAIRKEATGRGNTYYIMRHGLSDRKENTDMIISSSRLDSDVYHLTKDGAAAIQRTLNHLNKLEKIDAIYTSPFIRTKETAEIAAKIFHKEIQVDSRLGEIGHALENEGKPHGGTPLNPGVQHSFDNNIYGGESWNDVRKRFMEFMDEIDSQYRDKKILIVSHGDPLWLLDKMSRGLKEQEILDIKKTKKNWYPRIGEVHKIHWENLPRNELGELDLHKPFIDGITIKCESCGAEMKRTREVMDVWFDSGSMPYAQWHWPFENDKIFKQQFPADFIVEGVDMTRGWFYVLLAIATALERGAPFKNVIALGLTLDEKGQKMSKSIGNVISPFEAMDRVGADTTRWYLYTLSAPGDFKPISLKAADERLKGFMFTLQNCIRFYELYAPESVEIFTQDSKAINLLDQWLLSRFHGLTQRTTEALDAYDPTTAGRAIESFIIEDLSQWWLRRSRRRTEALGLLRFILLELAKLLAPFAPFVAEDIHVRLHRGQAPKIESVHLYDWPKVSKKLVNRKLEEEMARLKETVTTGLALRKEKQLKVRQPLAEVIIPGKKFNSDLETLIKDELNVKDIKYTRKGDLDLDLNITPDLRDEGFARELMRQIQDMRKEAKYKLDEKVRAAWHSDDVEISAAITHWSQEIAKDTLLSELQNHPQDDQPYDVQKELDLVPGKKVWLGIKN